MVKITILSALLLIPGISAAAQSESPEPCPAEYTCLDYEGATIQLDPADGPYQIVIVEERTIKITTLTQEATERSVVGAGFAQGDDGVFVFDREYHRSKTGFFKDADLEDIYGMVD